MNDVYEVLLVGVCLLPPVLQLLSGCKVCIQVVQVVTKSRGKPEQL